MAQSNNRLSLGVIVVCLAALGGVLFYSIKQLPAEPATASASIPPSQLFSMAEQGDVPALKAALTSGAAVDAVSPGGTHAGLSPVMIAALHAKPDAIKALADAKANVNMRGPSGKTALIYAAGWADAATVRALLDANARVDERTDDRWTALMIAAGRGGDDVVKMLVDSGADVNARNRWGQTPLMAAARSGDAAKIATLVQAGADANAVDSSGATALALACTTTDRGAAVDALLKAGANPAIADNDGVTALMRAADAGDKSVVERLVAAGAPRDTKDRSGRTAADWAKARDDDAGRAIAAMIEAK